MTENTNTEPTEPTTDLEQDETPEDQLLSLPAEKLVGLLRDKRKAEATVRAKLRETEAERDKLTGSVTGYQRRAFAEAASGHRMQESALDDVLGAMGDMSEVLGDDGTVDPEKVGPALAELQKSKPHYFQPVPRMSSMDMSAGTGEPRAQASWGDVLS